jgi:hypothetical protein
LGDNPEQREFVKRLKNTTNCKIVAILHLNVFVKSDENYADYTPYEIDSAGFINLIRNSEYVCTDSFHATVFSILHKKKFFTFRRFKANYTLQTNSRIDSLLSCLGLFDRLVPADLNVNEWQNREIDYDAVELKLQTLRVKNLEFLKKALKIN